MSAELLSFWWKTRMQRYIGARREAIEWIEYRRIRYIAASWFDPYPRAQGCRLCTLQENPYFLVPTIKVRPPDGTTDQFISKILFLLTNKTTARPSRTDFAVINVTPSSTVRTPRQQSGPSGQQSTSFTNVFSNPAFSIGMYFMQMVPSAIFHAMSFPRVRSFVNDNFLNPSSSTVRDQQPGDGPSQQFGGTAGEEDDDDRDYEPPISEGEAPAANDDFDFVFPPDFGPTLRRRRLRVSAGPMRSRRRRRRRNWTFSSLRSSKIFEVRYFRIGQVFIYFLSERPSSL